jgi:hypothetical protein
MRTPSIRTLAAIAYERGEEFDPGDPEMLSPTLARQLNETATGGTPVFGLSLTGRARLQVLEPELCPFDGELLAELAG